jgi:hypothetical protein
LNLSDLFCCQRTIISWILRLSHFICSHVFFIMQSNLDFNKQRRTGDNIEVLISFFTMSHEKNS